MTENIEPEVLKVLQETSERTWFVIKVWTTRAGLEARVHQCVWNERVTKVAASLHPFYCGYVLVPNLTVFVLEEIEVHGGVTFGPKSLGFDIEGDTWVGFDMAHAGDEGLQSVTYAMEQCELLAQQLIS